MFNLGQTCSNLFWHCQLCLDMTKKFYNVGTDVDVCQKYDTTALAIKCNLKLVLSKTTESCDDCKNNRSKDKIKF